MAKKKKVSEETVTPIGWVVLKHSINGNFHYCEFAAYLAAKDLPGYEWEVIFEGETEEDCKTHILILS